MRTGRESGSSRPAGLSRGPAPVDPPIPQGVTADSLDRVTANSLRTLPDGLSEIVAVHLAAAAAVIADDPERALAHARAAARRAARVAVVREAVGVAAYAAGDYGEASRELKAAARISGSSEYLPMIADCERGLGRPERALALASGPEVATLDREARVEMLIVAAGARRDLGQPDAAVLALQVPALNARSGPGWLPRLRYAYADALLAVGREAEARAWFVRAAQADPEGATDALERVEEIDGIEFDEVDEVDLADAVDRGADVDELDPVDTDREVHGGDVHGGDVHGGDIDGGGGEVMGGAPHDSGSDGASGVRAR